MKLKFKIALGLLFAGIAALYGGQELGIGYLFMAGIALIILSIAAAIHKKDNINIGDMISSALISLFTR